MADGLKGELLCEIAFDIAPGHLIPATGVGHRMIAQFTGGTVTGPRLNGELLPAGGDWLTIGSDGIMRIDVRGVIRADDGTIIQMNYVGRMVIPPHLADKASDPAEMAKVYPSEYYFRSTPVFEAPTDSAHAWLNDKVSVGIGRVLATGGAAYRIYTVE